MRKAAPVLTASLLAFGFCAVATAQSPVFGSRENVPPRGESRPFHATKVYDNDNLPSTDSLSVVGAVPDVAANPRNDTTSNLDGKSDIDQKSKAVAEIKPGQSPQERLEAYAHWKKRISKRLEMVEQLARELEDLKRNAPMSVAILHLWPDDQMYLQLVGEKQKALDEAEANLSDLQEEARKAGVPSSFRDGDAKISEGASSQGRKMEYAAEMSVMQTRKARIISSDGTGPDESIVLPDSGTKEKPGKEKKDEGEIKPGQSPEERQKAYAAWKKQIEERKGKVDRLTRELEDLTKNVPTAVILHLWPEDEIYLQMMADKQKTLDQAKAELGDSQEQARKAGVPSSFTY